MKDKKMAGIITALASFVAGGQKAQAGADKAIAEAGAPPVPSEAGSAEKKAPDTPTPPSKPRKAKGGPKLAPIIDKYLLEGGHTAGEIAGFVDAEIKEAGVDTKGKDLKANVRARMIHHRKKNATVVRAKNGKIKVTLAVE